MKEPKSDTGVEGEGSYEGTRRYNAGLQEFVAEGRSSELAEAANQGLSGPEDKTLRDAEAAGKAGHPIHRRVEPADIVPHAPVMCSKNGQFAVVDHMESNDTIKLAKDQSGQHHFIPLSWVTFVDDKVHVDRPGDQAMREWSMTPPQHS
jgi:hypothetical protein